MKLFLPVVQSAKTVNRENKFMDDLGFNYEKINICQNNYMSF